MFTGAHSGLGTYSGFETPVGTELSHQIAAYNRFRNLGLLSGNDGTGEVIYGELTGKELVELLSQQAEWDKRKEMAGAHTEDNKKFPDLGRTGDGQFQVSAHAHKPSKLKITDEMIAETAGIPHLYTSVKLTDNVRARCAEQLPE